MIKIANAPCSWGVLEFDLEGEAAGFEQVLDEMQATGYEGTELGDWDFMPTDPAALVSATLSAMATDLEASARFGFLSIGIDEGTLNANLDLNATLIDPGTNADDGRIDLRELIDSLDDEVDEDAEQAWSVEIARRLDELNSGSATTVPWSQARRRIFGG